MESLEDSVVDFIDDLWADISNHLREIIPNHLEGCWKYSSPTVKEILVRAWTEIAPGEKDYHQRQ